MPFHWRQIDPDRANLERALDQACAAALQDAAEEDGLGPIAPGALERPDLDALLAQAAREPEGTHVRHAPVGPEDTGPAVVVAWWADLLRRRHWGVASGGVSGDDCCFSSPGKYMARVTDHPLGLIYPDYASCWRERGDRRDWLVLCACGACGTVEQVGWTGQCCGPCFDRFAEEGGTPGPAGLPVENPWLFDGEGRLVGGRRGADGELRLLMFPPPWRPGPPAWEASLPPPKAGKEKGYIVGSMACDGQRLGVTDNLGRLLLFDTRDGRLLHAQPFRQPGDPTGPWDGPFLAFAGLHKELLAALPWPASSGAPLRVWERRQARPDFRLRSKQPGNLGALEVTPDGGGLFLGTTRGTVELREAGTGKLLRRLSLPGGGWCRGLAAAPDGAVLASFDYQGPQWRRQCLARWAPAPAEPPAGALQRLRRMMRGPEAEAPEVTRETEGSPGPLFLSPDGRRLVMLTGTEMALLSPITLQEQARFTFTSLWNAGCFGFSPDGEHLAVSAWSFTLWPVRQLFGA